RISDDLVTQLLEAAMYAPSARNEQPWHFIVIDDRKILGQIPSIHPYAEMLREAPLAILVCGDKKIEKSVEYIAIDCAAATQNILLASHELGLGSCWLGVYPRESRMKGLSELFTLPQNIIPISLVAVGYPAEKKETPERFIRERVHLNGW
ncbi:MAG: NADH dehydrogenase, partial [Ignavibacteria bacterium RBG_13_36_8]